MKKAVEAYWAGKLSADELTKAAADVKKASWTSLKERGVTLIPRYVHQQANLKIGNLSERSFSAVTSPSTIMSWTTPRRSTSSPSGMSARTCLRLMSTSLWAVAVRPTVSMSLPQR